MVTEEYSSILLALEQISLMTDDQLTPLLDALPNNGFKQLRRVVELRKLPDGAELHGQTLSLTYSPKTKAALDLCDFQELKINNLKPKHFKELMLHSKVNTISSLKFIGDDWMPRRGNSWILTTTQLEKFKNVKELVVERCLDSNDLVPFLEELKTLDTSSCKLRRMEFLFSKINLNDLNANYLQSLFYFKHRCFHQSEEIFGMYGYKHKITFFVERISSDCERMKAVIHETEENLNSYMTNKIREVRELANGCCGLVAVEVRFDNFCDLAKIYPQKALEEDIFKRLHLLNDDLLLKILSCMDAEALLSSQMINQRIRVLARKVRKWPYLSNSRLKFSKRDQGVLSVDFPGALRSIVVDSAEKINFCQLILSFLHPICLEKIYFDGDHIAEEDNPLIKSFLEDGILHTKKICLRGSHDFLFVLDKCSYEMVVVDRMEPQLFDQNFLIHPKVKKADTLVCSWPPDADRLNRFQFGHFEDNKEVEIYNYNRPFDLIPFLKSLRSAKMKGNRFKELQVVGPLSNDNPTNLRVDGLHEIYQNDVEQRGSLVWSVMAGPDHFSSVFIKMGTIEDSDSYSIKVSVHRDKKDLFHYGFFRIFILNISRAPEIDADDMAEFMDKFIVGDWNQMAQVFQNMQREIV